MENFIIKNILNFVKNDDDEILLDHYGGKGKGKSKSKKMKKKKKKKEEGEEPEEPEESEYDEYSETSEEYYEEDVGFFASIFGSKSPKRSKSSNSSIDSVKLISEITQLTKEIYKNRKTIIRIVDENPELAYLATDLLSDFVTDM